MAPGYDNLREDDDGYDSADDLEFDGSQPAEEVGMTVECG